MLWDFQPHVKFKVWQGCLYHTKPWMNALSACHAELEGGALLVFVAPIWCRTCPGQVGLGWPWWPLGFRNVCPLSLQYYHAPHASQCPADDLQFYLRSASKGRNWCMEADEWFRYIDNCAYAGLHSKIGFGFLQSIPFLEGWYFDLNQRPFVLMCFSHQLSNGGPPSGGWAVWRVQPRASFLYAHGILHKNWIEYYIYIYIYIYTYVYVYIYIYLLLPKPCFFLKAWGVKPGFEW